MGLVLASLLCFGIFVPVGTAAANPAGPGMPANPSEALPSLGGFEGPRAGAAEVSHPAPNLVRTGTRLFSATLVLIGLLALGSYGIRRFMNHRGSLSRPGAMIRVLTTRSLGARSSLAVVEIGDERFVIGVSPQRISFLTGLAGAAEEDGVSRESSVFERQLQKTREKR